MVATGREAGVVAQAPDETEMEKRLSALFLMGAGTVAIDNCGFPGRRQLPVCLPHSGDGQHSPARDLDTGHGADECLPHRNRQQPRDRRRHDAADAGGAPRPPRRAAGAADVRFEPVAQAKAERVRYVTAVLTILLAFKAAGSPRQSNPLGSFEDWSLLVRDALIWLGCADPVGTMERARVSDPKLDELSAVLTQWRAVIGTDRITVRRVIEKASRQSGGTGYDFNPKEFDNPDFREALLAVAGQGGAINGKRLGKWLGAHAKRIAGGCWIEQDGTHAGAALWRLEVPA